MSANHPLLSAECAKPFTCGGCVGLAWNEETQEVVDCEHYCHNRSYDPAILDNGGPDPRFSATLDSHPDAPWEYDRYSHRERELVDA